MSTLIRRTAYTLFALLFFIQLGYSQSVNLDEKIPLDSKVKSGTLPNGLRYFIRQNKKPEQKVELRLVINAGSILEDEDQQGIAHFNEHMAFNGTTNFKKNEIVSFLQDIGVGFGNDLNAYTSFDETVYMLPIPTDKPANIEKGFRVLEDWAHNVTYLPEDIKGERPIVLEESRNGKGAEDRMFRKIYPILLSGSKYAERLPIGKDSIIKNASPEAIKRFYKTWYRPNLMAVIVVGDMDPLEAEKMIVKHFSGLANPTNERARDYATVDAYKESSALIVTDKEATSYSASINWPVARKEPTTTVQGYRNDVVQNIFTSLLNQRLQELTQKENPPFNYAGVGFGSFARGYEGFQAYVGLGSGDIAKAVDAAATEIERVNKYGFTDAELERAKKSTMASYERMYNNREKTESGSFVEEYIQYYLTQEPSPGIEKEYDYVKAMLPSITLQEVNAVANSYKNLSAKFAYITGPEDNTAKLPTEAALLAIIDKSKADLKPYEEKVIATNLLTNDPTPGKIISQTKDAVLGTTEIKLSNGVTVTLKPTDFNNDQILMGATRKGGKNNYGLADKYNAEYATAVVSAMGIGQFAPTDLKKAMAGKTASVSPNFSAISEGVRGSSTVKDLETMLQLNYLYFTAPRKDTSLFKSFVQRNKSQFMMMMADPTTSFIDTMYKVLYMNNPLAPIAIPRSEYYDKINLDRAMAIYKERFSNAAGMNFVLVGKFDVEQIKPLLEKYIASLPADTTKKFMFIDNKVRPVQGIKNMTVYKGKEQKSMILGFYNGEMKYSEDMAFKADALSEVLNILVVEELREKVQGIYGGGTYASLSKYPYGSFQFVLQLPCGPEKVDTLLKVAKKEFKVMVTNGPKEKYMTKIKAQMLEDNKTAMKENGTWLGKLLEYKIMGGKTDRFINYPKYVNALTAKDVQSAARILFSTKNQLTAVLMPEKK